ncbi:MAG TPA: CHAT domain-containing tetratricopeptide repeat protein [Candidatus Solibacter sp.]|nr:CHAT domain-containing tetratricopeptide repeat protein [Candidatus Solibacter sp.]
MAVTVLTLDQLIGELAKEPNPRRRRQLLQAHREAWRPETVSRLYEEVVRLLHVDVQQAERIARAASTIADAIADDPSQAASLRALAHIYYRKRQYKESVDLYEHALEIYERAGDEREAARTLNSSLQSLIYLGRYPEAEQYARRARDIFERLGDKLRLARLDANMGNILYRQDCFEDALSLYERAYQAFLEIGEPQDVAISLKNTATCQISLNNFTEALATYEKARAYCVEHQMPLLVAVADYNIAYLYYLRGEYTRAIELYRAAREDCGTFGDAYRQALCDLDQSEMYLELNLIEEGAHLAERAQKLFRELGMGYEAAKAQTNLAISLSHHGQVGVALKLFHEARQLFEQEHNRAWIATIDLYQALVYHRDQRLDEALELCQRALDFFKPSPLFTKSVLAQLLLARIHLDRGQRELAKETCKAALHLLESEHTPALSYQAWYVLGTIEESLNAPKAAYKAYLRAHHQLENLRSHLKAEEMKIAFLKDKLEVYEALVRMCLDRGDTVGNREAAFLYIEQAKSRSLADLIAFRSQGLPASRKTERALVEQVNTLRGELNWYSRTIQLLEGRAANLMAPQLVKLRRAARDCEQRLVEALANLRTEDQEYANLQAAGAIPLESIRASLPDDAILVQYYRVRDTFYTCLLSKKDLKILPVGSVNSLKRTMQLLRFQLSKFRLGAEYVRTFHQQLLDAANSHLTEFYGQLLAPIEDHLNGAEHLIVAPHDFLHYLPFHALPGKDGNPIGERYSFSYAPSASVYHLCKSKPALTGGGKLVFGVPDPAAPQILDEVRAVSGVLGDAEVFVGAEATDEVLRQKGPSSRLVHIATHGWFRQDNPMFSSISLGNAHLSLFDLYQLDLPCELVTLSGCGTGLNVVVGGDELLGLVRGLLYAGTQGVLVTLWDVNDQSTADFMKLFYENLRSDGRNKAEAVRRAMREVRKEYAHPFYWAPFVLVGKHD